MLPSRIQEQLPDSFQKRTPEHSLFISRGLESASGEAVLWLEGGRCSLLVRESMFDPFTLHSLATGRPIAIERDGIDRVLLLPLSGGESLKLAFSMLEDDNVNAFVSAFQQTVPASSSEAESPLSEPNTHSDVPVPASQESVTSVSAAAPTPPQTSEPASVVAVEAPVSVEAPLPEEAEGAPVRVVPTQPSTSYDDAMAYERRRVTPPRRDPKEATLFEHLPLDQRPAKNEQLQALEKMRKVSRGLGCVVFPLFMLVSLVMFQGSGMETLVVFIIFSFLTSNQLAKQIKALYEESEEELLAISPEDTTQAETIFCAICDSTNTVEVELPERLQEEVMFFGIPYRCLDCDFDIRRLRNQEDFDLLSSVGDWESAREFLLRALGQFEMTDENLLQGELSEEEKQWTYDGFDALFIAARSLRQLDPKPKSLQLDFLDWFQDLPVFHEIHHQDQTQLSRWFEEDDEFPFFLSDAPAPFHDISPRDAQRLYEEVKPLFTKVSEHHQMLVQTLKHKGSLSSS